MKTKEKTNKKFDAVKMMRDIRNKIDEETKGMNYEELKSYLQKQKSRKAKESGSAAEGGKHSWVTHYITAETEGSIAKKDHPLC